MAAVHVLLLLILTCVGIVAGFALPLRFCGQVPGFNTGILFGGLFSLLLSLMVGALVAGRAEQAIGTNIGVPIGAFLGCFLGATLANFAAGALGALISFMLRH